MYLIVGCTPHAGWRRLLPILTQGGCQVADDAAIDRWRRVVTGTFTTQNDTARKAYRELLDSCNNPGLLPVGGSVTAEQLAVWVKEFDDTLLLLFHTRPEGTIIKAVAENQDPVAALQAWETAARQLLQANRHHRPRTRMLDVDCAVKAPAEFQQACRDHLGLAFSEGDPDGIKPGYDEATSSEQVHRLMAAQTVAQSPTAQDLINELEASSVPVGAPACPLSVDCHEAFEELQHKQDVQLVEQENELLLLQLHQVQEELESYYLDLEKETKKRQQAEEQLEAVRTSLSWKVTAPLRAVGKPFLNRRQHSGNT